MEATHGHVLVVYDNRNPAFHAGGRGDLQWRAAVSEVLRPQLLPRISWQRLASRLVEFESLTWLTDGLREKYGIVAATSDPARSRP